MFPCENFDAAPYPFSRSYLEMHTRRKNESPKAYAPDGSHLEVDKEYWEALADRDKNDLCNVSFFDLVSPEVMQFRFLNQDIRIDISKRCLYRKDGEQWETTDDPLLTLVTVMYLKSIDAVYPMGKDIVGVKDLKEGHFFTGPHEFRIQPLLKRFEKDPDGFRNAGTILDGKEVDMADVALQVLPFPRVPLYFLLWCGDEEFKSRLQVLFDRSIELSLSADAIWALVNRVAMEIASV